MNRLIVLFITIITHFAHSELVDVLSLVPDIKIDLKYATEDNYAGQILYSFKKCYVQKEAALRLSEVQNELRPLGLALKIWDGYRPLSVQWKFWELIHDERYVSNPLTGACNHTRGTAVDITLVTMDNRELPMPTAFDDFTEKAHIDYMGCTQEQLENRKLLQEVMEKHGFSVCSTEWWHFDLIGWEAYPQLDVNPE